MPEQNPGPEKLRKRVSSVEQELGEIFGPKHAGGHLSYGERVHNHKLKLVAELIADARLAADFADALESGMRLHKRTFPHRGAWLAACDKWEAKTQELLARVSRVAEDE